jgi:hypothetical protein
VSRCTASVPDDVLHRCLEHGAAQRKLAGATTKPADVRQRVPAAHDAEAHDVFAGVDELRARRRAGRRASAAQRREQGAVAGDALDRRVADGAVGLLLIDPGYAGERVGTHGGGALGRVLALRPARRRSLEAPRPQAPER